MESSRGTYPAFCPGFCVIIQGHSHPHTQCTRYEHNHLTHTLHITPKQTFFQIFLIFHKDNLEIHVMAPAHTKLPGGTCSPHGLFQERLLNPGHPRSQTKQAFRCPWIEQGKENTVQSLWFLVYVFLSNNTTGHCWDPRRSEESVSRDQI